MGVWENLKTAGEWLYEEWQRPAGGQLPGPSSEQSRCGGQLTGDEMRYGVKQDSDTRRSSR